VRTGDVNDPPSCPRRLRRRLTIDNPGSRVSSLAGDRGSGCAVRPALASGVRRNQTGPCLRSSGGRLPWRCTAKAIRLPRIIVHTTKSGKKCRLRASFKPTARRDSNPRPSGSEHEPSHGVVARINGGVRVRGPRSVSSSPGRELRDSFGDISIVRMVDAGRACGAAPLAKPTRLYVGRSTTLHIPFGALLSAISRARLRSVARGWEAYPAGGFAASGGRLVSAHRASGDPALNGGVGSCCSGMRRGSLALPALVRSGQDDEANQMSTGY
jgi:hypothetical protein